MCQECGAPAAGLLAFSGLTADTQPVGAGTPGSVMLPKQTTSPAAVVRRPGLGPYRPDARHSLAHTMPVLVPVPGIVKNRIAFARASVCLRVAVGPSARTGRLMPPQPALWKERPPTGAPSALGCTATGTRHSQ